MIQRTNNVEIRYCLYLGGIFRKKCNIKEAAAAADKNCETKLIEKDNKIKALEEKIFLKEILTTN